jgi:hypothetical protein
MPRFTWRASFFIYKVLERNTLVTCTEHRYIELPTPNWLDLLLCYNFLN